MSVVTDIIITFALTETETADGESYEPIEYINRWLEKQKYYGTFADIGKHGGGRKAHQAAIYSGAFGGLDLDEFAAVLLHAGWQSPSSVTLLIQLEDDDTMREVRIPAINKRAVFFDSLGFNKGADELRAAIENLQNAKVTV